MARKIISVTLATMVILAALSGLALAQTSGTYTQPPTAPPPSEPLLPPGPAVPDGWVRIPMLDKNELILKLNDPPAIINATIPSGFGSPGLNWSSTNTSVITVVANSPARVTPVGLGTAHAIVNLTYEGTTYYDYCYVRVIADDAVATPGTAGSTTTLILLAGLLFTAALPPLYKSRFEQ
ncbi:MAG: hypothetical protein SCJ94_11455 [Bacillota bacterium]|nr:hypothetical protein [Bacillota bacterium]